MKGKRISVFQGPGIMWMVTVLCTLGLGYTTAAFPAENKPNTSLNLDSTESLRSFDAVDFELAYDVLLGAGDLKRAFLVAQKAVQASPEDRLWRLKLARVSNWTQHPEVATQQWLTLFKWGDRTLEVVQGVVVGAHLVKEPQWMLLAWTELAKRQTLTPPNWIDILATYEELAEPANGSQFFEEEFIRRQNPLLLEYAGRLAENAGDDTRALRLYQRRAALAPFSMDVTLKAVVLMIRLNKMQDALALLQTHRNQVPARSHEYWYLLGEVAWETREYDLAKEAYTQYAKMPQANSADWSRLIYLVRRDHPAQAADFAVEAFRRFSSIEQLLYGLGIYAELGDHNTQARVLAALDPATVAELVKNPQFLTLRAQLYQRQGKSELAWDDYRSLLQIAPHDANAILANLWFLIDHQHVDLLRSFVRQYHAVALKNATYWQAFAAANQTLELHREAVFWYAKAVVQNSNDVLMLLNYADALERTAQVGMAGRIRRHAWQLLKQQYPQTPAMPADQMVPQMLALARLMLMDQPGDPSLELVRQWVQQMRGLQDAPATEQTAVLVLGWSIVKEQPHNARQWMWTRYARQSRSAPPIWGDSQTALQLHETQVMDQLLTRRADALPLYNRYDTAYALGHLQQALGIAFHGMTVNEDEPLYDRYRQHVPGQANYTQVQWESNKQNSLASRGLRVETRLVVHPKLQITMSASHQMQTGSGALMRPLTPDTERISKLQMLWKGASGDSRLVWARREELDGLMSFQLSQSIQWGARLQLQGGLDVGSPTAISLPLRVAGYENSLVGVANFTLGRREYIRAGSRFVHYFTSWGDSLGTGRIFDAEFGYRLRTDYPDWRLRTFLTHQSFSREAGVSSLVVPEGSTTVGLCLNMGENLSGQNLQTTYSRAWRPFFDACLDHNAATGNGLRGAVGMAGSLNGEDHLLIQLQHADDTLPGASPTQSLVVRYRHYF